MSIAACWSLYRQAPNDPHYSIIFTTHQRKHGTSLINASWWCSQSKSLYCKMSAIKQVGVIYLKTVFWTCRLKLRMLACLNNCVLKFSKYSHLICKSIKKKNCIIINCILYEFFCELWVITAENLTFGMWLSL